MLQTKNLNNFPYESIYKEGIIGTPSPILKALIEKGIADEKIGCKHQMSLKN
jgi:hypothetical protein